MCRSRETHFRVGQNHWSFLVCPTSIFSPISANAPAPGFLPPDFITGEKPEPGVLFDARVQLLKKVERLEGEIEVMRQKVLAAVISEQSMRAENNTLRAENLELRKQLYPTFSAFMGGSK